MLKDSILSQASTSSFTDDTSSLRGTLTKSKLKPQPDLYSLVSIFIDRKSLVPRCSIMKAMHIYVIQCSITASIVL